MIIIIGKRNIIIWLYMDHLTVFFAYPKSKIRLRYSSYIIVYCLLSYCYMSYIVVLFNHCRRTWLIQICLLAKLPVLTTVLLYFLKLILCSSKVARLVLRGAAIELGILTREIFSAATASTACRLPWWVWVPDPFFFCRQKYCSELRLYYK